MAITVVLKSPPHTGFLLIAAVDAGITTVRTTLQQLPAGQPQAVKIAV
jgi:hypothetical protein